ncbi:MAG: hypothetical protein ACLFS3_01995 [Candidatus Aenigmatarchaeota archaeon]
MDEECTIGYFKEDGKTYAGKNREPGKNSLDVLEVKTSQLEEPKLIYLGIDPWQETKISDAIYKAHEEDVIWDLKDDLDIKLHDLKPNETIPTDLENKLSDNIWGGLYPDKRIGMPAPSPTKAIYLLPTDMDPMGGDLMTVANASFYNLSRTWGGMNEEGLFVQSSSIRHDGRLENRPSYSVLINEILGKCETPEEGIEYFSERVKDYKAGAANFMIANDNKQLIAEYIPADVIKNTKEPSIDITEGENEDFRTNFARETELEDQIGFFKREGWNLDDCKDVYEVQNFIRSINRQLASFQESGEEVFNSHTVYPDLYENEELLGGILDNVYKGELLDMAIPQKEQYASFYSICTHPVIEQIPWANEYTENTYKRTQWSWKADLDKKRSNLNYDNPCAGDDEANTGIVIDMDDIQKALEVI